jgi:hypothetical protein
MSPPAGAELAELLDEGNDPPISAYAAVAAHWGLPIWAMMVPGLSKGMFEDLTKMMRLVKLMRDYLSCSETHRTHVEEMAAGLAELNRHKAPPAVRA